MLSADPTKGVGVNISIGSTSTSIDQKAHVETVNLSNISAGGNVNVKASQGDINLTGSKITGTDITLDANKDINIKAAQNKQDTTTNTSSSSWSLGGTIGVGYSGSFSSSTGKENEKTTTHTGSVVQASDTANLKSGNDTNIIGSKVIGEQVKAEVGNNLNIESKQDSSYYDANNQSVGIGFSTGQVENGKKEIGSVTGSVNAGNTNSTFDSVTSQSGFYAGDGGVKINVKGNTNLNAGVISSEAPAVKNAITTGSLTVSNMENRAQYYANTSGFGFTIKDGKISGLPNIGMPASGEASSTTQSAISPGTIIVNGVIVNPENLSRDTTSTLNALGQIFDKKTVQERQELAQVFGEVAFKAVGDFAESNWKNAKDNRDKAKTVEEKEAYQREMDKWAEGGANKVLLHALAGGIMSQLSGNGFSAGAVGAGVTQALQGELAKITDPGLRLIASSIVGAAAAKVVGGDGQVGAGAGYNGTKYNDILHDVKSIIDWIAEKKEESKVSSVKKMLEMQGITPDNPNYDQIVSATMNELEQWEGTVIEGGYKVDIKQVRSAAKLLDMTDLERREFGKYIEAYKEDLKRRGNQNFTFKELIEIGKEFLGR